MRLIDPKERPVTLSKSECASCWRFSMRQSGRFRASIYCMGTRLHEDIFDRSIDVQVLRLRRKLEADPKAPRVIKTKGGVGYAFVIPVLCF